MDEHDRDGKQNDDRSYGEVKLERDAKFPTLADRAEHIMKLLQQEHPELTTWDVTCFCVGFLGVQCIGWEWLRDPFKPLAHRVSVTHYIMDEFGLETEVPRGTLLRKSSEIQDGESKTN